VPDRVGTWGGEGCGSVDEVMTVFGVTDKLHWLVLSGNQEAPVLFDRQYRPKPAYHALLEELGSASSRRATGK